MIYVTLNLYIVGSLDSVDFFNLFFDSAKWSMSQMPGFSGICDISATGQFSRLKIIAKVPHTINTLNVIFKAIFDQPANDESIGSRDLEIILQDSSVITTNLCLISPKTLSDKWCPCSTAKEY